MTTQCFICIFLWVYVLQLIFCVNPEKTPTSGPFKTSITSIKDCSNPSKPYMKNPPVDFQATSQNNTLSGNFTVLKDTKNVKIKLRSFILRNGKWEPAFRLKNLDCHGMVLHFACVTMNVKYDRRNCLYFKGTYYFKNLDMNQLMHSWFSNVQYGRTKWISETYSQAGLFYCKEFDTVVQPA